MTRSRTQTPSASVDLLALAECVEKFSSKTVVLGPLPLLVALVVARGIDSIYAARALIVAILVLILNPLASHALARAAYRAGVPMWSGAVADQPRERPDEIGEA